MSLRILIVDDHAVVRRGVRSLPESHEGWEVCGEATTGRDAVAQSLRLRPDIVVRDMSLPELNGLDATRQILKAAPDTEVLVLTMHHSEEGARIKSCSLDPNAYVAASSSSPSSRLSAATSNVNSGGVPTHR